MALSTYAELQTAINDWLNRDDLSAFAPTFVTLAEQKLNRDVRHWRGETRKTATFDDRFTALPTDFYEIRRLVIDNQRDPLWIIPAHEMQELRAASGDTAGVPKYMALIDQSFEVYPTPNDTFSGVLVYRAKIPALADDNTSNWLLEEAPDAYLYGSLVATAPFLKDDARLGVWTALYQEAVQTLNQQSERATHGGNLKMRIGA